MADAARDFTYRHYQTPDIAGKEYLFHVLPGRSETESLQLVGRRSVVVDIYEVA
jgi:hypothetical protein